MVVLHCVAWARRFKIPKTPATRRQGHWALGWATVGWIKPSYPWNDCFLPNVNNKTIGRTITQAIGPTKFHQVYTGISPAYNICFGEPFGMETVLSCSHECHKFALLVTSWSAVAEGFSSSKDRGKYERIKYGVFSWNKSKLNGFREPTRSPCTLSRNTHPWADVRIRAA